MMFKTRRIAVEAEQFWPDKPWPKGVEYTNVLGLGICHHIMTSRGAIPVRPGQWVIRFSERSAMVIGAVPFGVFFEPLSEEEVESIAAMRGDR